ncbi:hypothetical protein L2E82_36178 [Cichorium intybus]|uniref:Uncharacterized protein n=1 Tax=Cichorium intybus TaxID=13427 RepID=A0ACB9BR68_CICIN|nr:hypothetical protein L2E82_36178 [Cichorium intybus]
MVTHHQDHHIRPQLPLLPYLSSSVSGTISAPVPSPPPHSIPRSAPLHSPSVFRKHLDGRNFNPTGFVDHRSPGLIFVTYDNRSL